jgi:hypothetical protein
MKFLLEVTEAREVRQRVAVARPRRIENIHVAGGDLHLCRRPVPSLSREQKAVLLEMTGL